MADPSIAETVDTVGTDVNDVGKAVDTETTKLQKSIGEVLSDPHFWYEMSMPFFVTILAGVTILTLVHWQETIKIFSVPGAILDALIAVVTLCFLIFIYLYILQPVIQIRKGTHITQLCPDRWDYNPKTSLCEPKYSTTCRPFNPKNPGLQSFAAQCDLALACATDWGKKCML